jgi:NADH dehydrogenase
VNEFLQVEGSERIYAAGDGVALTDPRTGWPYPKVAPIAISQGVRAAANVESHALGLSPEPYQAHHAGSIVSLGAGVALVEILGVRVTGRVAWWIYRSAYLFKLVGLKNKIRLLITLGLNLLFERDISSTHKVPTSTHGTARARP